MGFGRTYTVSFESVTVSAAQDFFQIKGASGKLVLIRKIRIGADNTTLTTAQHLQTRCRFLPSTVTDGSGGSTPTPRATDHGSPAASFTALANNTTQASTNGTAKTLAAEGNHIYQGIAYDWSREDAPVIGPSQSFTCELISTVSGTCDFSGTITVEEVGG